MSFLPGVGLNMNLPWDPIGDNFWRERQYQEARDVTQTAREDAERAAERANAEARAQWERNYQAQKEFAQFGVRWKAEDAAAAGLHPVYGAGLGGAAFAPAINVMSSPAVEGQLPSGFGGSTGSVGLSMGQDLSGAARAGGSEEEAAMQRMRMDLLRAQIDETDARTWAIYSDEARKSQEANARPGIPLGDVGAVHSSRVKPTADEMVSHVFGDRSTRAAPVAGLQQFYLTENLPIRLPSSEEGLSDVLENISWWQWPAIIAHNQGYYGSDWMRRFFNEFVLGKSTRFARYGSKEWWEKERRWADPGPMDFGVSP